MPNHQGFIGIFDSGYGGLTVMSEIEKKLGDYDYVYLGDNARAPYGTRSFETVYHYTWQCVKWLIDQGCPLVVLACNTASAKALRSIQQNDLLSYDKNARVLGVIRPTTEVIGNYSKTGVIGILATNGTVQSESYLIELKKFSPKVQIYQQACPMWVPLIENDEIENEGAEFFIKKSLDDLMNRSSKIDTILLACTHYPLIIDKIRKFLPSGIRVVAQGEIVADSLKDYLLRHPEIETRLNRNSKRTFYTTDEPTEFDRKATRFYGKRIESLHLNTESAIH